ncbi:hypothetical protein [Ruminococcus sp.]
MAGFLVYMTPAAFIVTLELATYFFGDKPLVKMIEDISISFHLLALINGMILVMTTCGNILGSIVGNNHKASVGINHKLMLCISIYIALGFLFSRIARKIAIKNDEKNDEDDRGEKI